MLFYELNLLFRGDLCFVVRCVAIIVVIICPTLADLKNIALFAFSHCWRTQKSDGQSWFSSFLKEKHTNIEKLGFSMLAKAFMSSLWSLSAGLNMIKFVLVMLPV